MMWMTMPLPMIRPELSYYCANRVHRQCQYPILTVTDNDQLDFLGHQLNKWIFTYQMFCGGVAVKVFFSIICKLSRIGRFRIGGNCIYFVFCVVLMLRWKIKHSTPEKKNKKSHMVVYCSARHTMAIIVGRWLCFCFSFFFFFQFSVEKTNIWSILWLSHRE